MRGPPQFTTPDAPRGASKRQRRTWTKRLSLCLVFSDSTEGFSRSISVCSTCARDTQHRARLSAPAFATYIPGLPAAVCACVENSAQPPPVPPPFRLPLVLLTILPTR